MNSTTRLLPTLALGLLLTTPLACDSEPGDQPDAELEASAVPNPIVDVERQLELEHDIELEFVAELVDEDGTSLLWTEITDVAPNPAAGTCGGKWEYKSTRYECGSCDVLGEDGKKYEHYKRWCWTGPGCASCDDWQYTGWSCFPHYCDSAIDPIDDPARVLAPQAADPDPTPSDFDVYGWTEAPSETSEPLEITAPPANGPCGGYWEHKANVDWQGCGTCTHTAPDPDREGNLGLWWDRWCWSGPGCAGCEPWFVGSTQCYDNCE
jgi:hypothetical protein